VPHASCPCEHRLLLNLVLLFPEDFVDDKRVVLRGRRREHIAKVHRAAVGDTLVAGRADGAIGTATIVHVDADSVEMTVSLDRDPPPPLPLTLVLAVPRPKVLNRVLAAATSLGIKQMFLINAWRVEKSYWQSPRLSAGNFREQSIAGLEQARDTILPSIEVRRFFRRFVEEELPMVAGDSLRIVAHPGAAEACPRAVAGAVTLAIGPEGGFIDAELASLDRAGFRLVSLGERVLRVETALAALVAAICL
jgi:16S rRNA (uracil1498-N3)-methyltransferase